MGEGIAPEGYEHDVFLSYRRHDRVDELRAWVETFRKLLWLALDDELPDEKDVEERAFLDRDMLGGTVWPDLLRRKLARSRTMVAILSPSYFKSTWCVSELRSFLGRRKGLVVPVLVHKGKVLPDDVDPVTLTDFSTYCVFGEAFTKTERYVDYQIAIKRLAIAVAEAIQSAPTYQPDFPIVEVSKAQLPPPPKPSLQTFHDRRPTP